MTLYIFLDNISKLNSFAPNKIPFIYSENALWKNWPKNIDLRFPIHKIAQTEKSSQKIKNKELRFPPTK